MASLPEDSYEKKRERYEQEKREILAQATALLEKHPAYFKAEVRIYDESLALQVSEPLDSFEKGSQDRLARTLKALDIRCESYLPLASDLDHLKAYRQKINWFVWEAWMYFCGFPMEMVPPPHPTVQLTGHQADVKRFWDRAQHWYVEGHRRLDLLHNPRALVPTEKHERRGYRSDIDAWMKREGLANLDQARRRLSISKDTLKSIRSSKGEKKYGDETLLRVLKEIGLVGE